MVNRKGSAMRPTAEIVYLQTNCTSEEKGIIPIIREKIVKESSLHRISFPAKNKISTYCFQLPSVLPPFLPASLMQHLSTNHTDRQISKLAMLIPEISKVRLPDCIQILPVRRTAATFPKERIPLSTTTFQF